MPVARACQPNACAPRPEGCRPRRPGGWTGRTLVIDNGSQTGEGERLAAEFGVASVTLPENGGVAVGYNAAISWAQEQGASHVLLSNNDLTFTDPDLATQLLAHAADVHVGLQ